MKQILRFTLPLLCLSLASPALAGECKKIRAEIVDVQVTEGCTSPNGFFFPRGEGSLAFAARQAGVSLREMIPLAYAHGLTPKVDSRDLEASKSL